MLQVSDNTLQQLGKFKYLGVIFISDGRRNREIDTHIVKVNAVLGKLYRSVVTARELLNTAKLSVFKSFIVPILLQNRRQKVFSRGLYVCARELDTLIIGKTSH